MASTKRQRQIDYIMLDQSQMHNAINAEATDAIGGGSDHRAVRMSLRIHGSRRGRWRAKSKQHPSFKSWRPASVDDYRTDLDRKFADANLIEKLQMSAATIEEMHNVD